MISRHFMTFYAGTWFLTGHVCRYLTNRNWMYILGWSLRWQQALQRGVECWKTERTKCGQVSHLFLCAQHPLTLTHQRLHGSHACMANETLRGGHLLPSLNNLHCFFWISLPGCGRWNLQIGRYCTKRCMAKAEATITISCEIWVLDLPGLDGQGSEEKFGKHVCTRWSRKHATCWFNVHFL